VSRLFFFFILIILQAVGLLGRVISSSQGSYLNTGQYKHRINTHTKHPCLVWDSNPRSQLPSERRRYMRRTAGLPWPAIVKAFLQFTDAFGRMNFKWRSITHIHIITFEWFAWIIITGSGLDDWIYWHFIHSFSSGLQAIQRCRFATHFPVHHCTRTRILSPH
jgi:hypothetical protein